MKKLKSGTIWIIAVVAVVLILLLTLWGSFNGLVSKEENVDEKWADVQSSYQRRTDLIPNLVTTVKASAAFEKQLQTEVTSLRTGITGAKTPQELDLLGNKINTAINLVYENYPQIKSTENFASLNDELAGTENRIKVDRDNFNEAVRDYNIKVRRFPSNIVAGMFNFEVKDSFDADEGAEKVVKVEL